MKTLLFTLFAFTLTIYSCKDNPATTENPAANTDFKKVMDASSGNTKFEIYKNGSENLTFGYNEIGFKVFLNSQEQTSGFVKFTPRYYDNVPVPGWVYKSSPVSFKFERNSNGFYTGYADFIMATNSNNTWFGFFNYNDQANADSIVFNVNSSSQAQQLTFQGPAPDTTWYFVTLMTPYVPKYGLNDYKCMLHSSSDYMNFSEINNAVIDITTWMPLMGHGSSNNVNPAYTGNCVYTGKINLAMSGIWEVYNAIKINGNLITSSPSPKFIFDCP
jgi:hypothetical protein